MYMWLLMKFLLLKKTKQNKTKQKTKTKDSCLQSF